MTEISDFFQNYYWQLQISATYNFLQINLCDRLGASAFSVVKLDLFIRALTLDHILAMEKNTRTPRVHLVFK